MADKQARLDPRTRKVIIAIGVAETALKVAALVDLVRRPADSVKGSKAGWAAAITAINSAGAVPIAYFVLGRRRPTSAT
jgi:hypothetical protein